MRKRDYCTAAPDWLPYCGKIGAACKQHDSDYGEGGTMINLLSLSDYLCRLAADIRLRESIQERAAECARRHPGRLFVFHRMFHRVAGFVFSWAYYAAVRTFGRGHWRWAKEKPAA